jgi:hypothetical protein
MVHPAACGRADAIGVVRARQPGIFGTAYAFMSQQIPGYNSFAKEGKMATPAFMLQRQQNFRFERNDPIVAYYLDEIDLNAIRQWQTQAGYTFEFHEMHDTGNPIYIRPDGNTAGGSMTKIDTRNIADPAVHYRTGNVTTPRWIENIPNFNVISRLGAPRIDEIRSIITNEWRYLQKLADRRWSGWRKPLTLMERAIQSGQYPPPPLRGRGNG